MRRIIIPTILLIAFLSAFLISQTNRAAHDATPISNGEYMDALHNAVRLDYSTYLPIVLNKSGDPVLVGAGDIADCDETGDEITSELVHAISGAVVTFGDNVYESGTTAEFEACYAPNWGRDKERTRPSVGNHEYRTANAVGYFTYFGAAAGDPSKGYYSYDVGAWHVIVINSNCSQVGGCEATSPQGQWLQADLEAHPALCTLAYWHHPLFSSGPHGNNPAMKPFWELLYQAGVELVLNGHDHLYERFSPQDPDGGADPSQGISEFIVGSGGKSHYSFGDLLPNSAATNDDAYGVIKLTLHPTSYDWEFIPEPGVSFADSGSLPCH